MNKFSVCTSIYKNDKPEFVRIALDSVLVNQSVKPTEVVLVQDGPVPYELSRLLIDYKDKFGSIFTVIKLKENSGLGNALRIGVENAKYEIIARMDSDDIAAPNRFEKQITYLEGHPECGIVGGQITEFIDTPENIVGKREVPLDNEDIYKYMKSRCAFNHPTVMFRKTAVLKVGNYKDWFWNEDYYLWIRMMMSGCVMANLPDVLVNMRSGINQYSRRGGMRYFKSEIGIKRIMLQNGLITKSEYLVNYIERFIIQLLLPNRVRGWVFRTFARKKSMIFKFIFDRTFSLIVLFVLWPVLLLVAIWVKIKMPGGPAFFVQNRVGKGGKLFKCHKFRTMTVKHNGSTVSVAGDSRITPFGAKLRHYKLDELPGLWDVLIGNMSFVGPRPDVPGYADKLKGEDRDVLKLRPGITGPATLKYRLEDEMLADVRSKMEEGKCLPKEQIDGMTDQELAEWYNDNVIYPDKVRINCYYYRHYSFIKDCQIILCTMLGKKMKYNNEII